MKMTFVDQSLLGNLRAIVLKLVTLLCDRGYLCSPENWRLLMSSTATAKPGFRFLHTLSKHRLGWESHGRQWQACEEYALAAMTFLSLLPPLIFSRGFYHRRH